MIEKSDDDRRCRPPVHTICLIIVLNAKFDTYPMRKTMLAQENAGLVADDLFEMLH